MSRRGVVRSRERVTDSRARLNGECVGRVGRFEVLLFELKDGSKEFQLSYVSITPGADQTMKPYLSPF